MNQTLQFWGLAALTLIAVVLLLLIGWVLFLIGSHITPAGNVPSGEAFGFTALLLAFREVIGGIKALWDHEDRATLTQRLADSIPNPNGRNGARE